MLTLEGSGQWGACSRLGARDEEAVAADDGGVRERYLAWKRLARLVGAQAARDLGDVCGEGDPIEVELGDLGDVVEHRRELTRHRLDLLLAELEARQARDVEYFLSVDHRAAFYGAP